MADRFPMPVSYRCARRMRRQAHRVRRFLRWQRGKPTLERDIMAEAAALAFLEACGMRVRDSYGATCLAPTLPLFVTRDGKTVCGLDPAEDGEP